MSHIVTYLLANRIHHQSNLVKIITMQHFSIPQLKSDTTGLIIQKEACEKIASLNNPQYASELKQAGAWHEAYSEFRIVALSTAHALELYHENKYSESLPYWIQACRRNLRLQSNNLPGACKGLPLSLLRSFRRKCLLVSLSQPYSFICSF